MDKKKRDIGLMDKYRVERRDGSSEPGGKHHGCEYFVLDLTHDPHARAALLSYAASCEAEYPVLAADLRRRYAATTYIAAAQKGVRAVGKKSLTPGPWTVVRSYTCGHLRAGHNYQDDPFAEWTDADIALINAAPALLSALDDIVALAKAAMGEANKDGGEYDIDAELADARAALAYARAVKGETK